MRILVNMVYPLCIKQRCTTLNTMNLVTFFQQKLCQVRTILTGYTGNKCFFHFFSLLNTSRYKSMYFEATNELSKFSKTFLRALSASLSGEIGRASCRERGEIAADVDS